MRRATLAVITITAAMVAVASCASTAKPTTAQPAVTAASPAASSPTPTPTPSPTPTVRAPFAIGAAWAWESTAATNKISGNSTVESYQQDVAHDAPSPEKAFGAESHGYVWASLKVKVCSDTTSAKTVSVSSGSWKLAYDDGTIVEPSNTGYSAFPQPKFPMGDVEMAPGRCVAGAIVFPVPGDKRPARAMYAPASLTDPAEWNLPAA